MEQLRNVKTDNEKENGVELYSYSVSQKKCR